MTYIFKKQFSFVALIGLIICSCQNDNKNPKTEFAVAEDDSLTTQPVVLVGKTDDSDVFRRLNILDASYIISGQHHDIIETGSNNLVTYNLNAISSPRIIEIMGFGSKHPYYNTRIWVTPGDSIHMEIKNGNILFSGENAAHYNFFIALDSLVPKWPSYQGNLKIYKNEVKKMYLEKQKILENYIKNNNVSEDFKLKIGDELKFEYLYNLVNPRSVKSEIGDVYYNTMDGFIPLLESSFSQDNNLFDLNDYFDNISIKDFQRPDLKNSEYFKRSLTAFVRYYFMPQDHPHYSQQGLQDEMTFIQNNFEGNLEKYAIGKLFYDYFDHSYAYGIGQTEQFLSMVANYKNENTLLPPSYKLMDTIYEQALKFNDLGNIPRNLFAKTLSTQLLNKELDTLSLKEVFDATKGKVKILHLWFGHSLDARNIKAAAAYTKRLQDKNVAIIYLFIDKRKEEINWTDSNEDLKDYFNSDYQFKVLNPEKSPLLKALNVTFLPRFIIFDEEGKLQLLYAPSTLDSIALNGILEKLGTK